ncbi:hypothetical protein Tco_0202291 [Tanacetum coccineum]
MWDRFRVKSSSFERGRRNDIRIDSFDDDLTTLDSTFREQMLRAAEEKSEYNHMEAEDNAVHADDVGDGGGESVDTTAIVKDVREEKNDEGDAAAAKDSQPSESRGSLNRHVG